MYSSNPTCDTPACSDAATAQTIRRMCGLVEQLGGRYLLFRRGQAVPYMFGKRAALATGLQRLERASREAATCAIACWWFARHFITFENDQNLVRRLVGDPASLEGLMSPAVMIQCVDPRGDCDCFTMFICALLESLRHHAAAAGHALPLKWEIVTLACSRRQPGIWSHVYPRAICGPLVLALDASHGKYPGWSVPVRDIQRVAVWDRDGSLVVPRDPAMGPDDLEVM